MIDTQVNPLGIRAQPLTQQLGIGDIHSTDKLGIENPEIRLPSNI